MGLFNYSEDALYDTEVLANASYVVCEILAKRNNANGGAEFENYFFSADFLDTVFGNLFKHPALTGNLASILIGVLQLQIQVSYSIY